MDRRPLTSDPGCYVITPSTEEDVRWAAGLARRVYQGFDAIPEETMLAWFHANPTGFSTLYRGEQRVGNFDVLPLKPSYMRRFVEGELLEIDLPPESMFTPEQRGEIADLYWESVLIDPDISHARRHVLRELVVSYKTVFDRICPLHQIVSMYAIAASKEGAAVVRALGMEPQGDPSGRRDAHQLYCGTLASLVAGVQSFVRVKRRPLEC